MPNRDGTGPKGKGPRTGRDKGPCTTEEALETKRKKKDEKKEDKKKDD